ncbi:conserved hypothetical protein [Ricinus communis]|uniref:Uncharacterized protein n=1 Tax=Ricinus communis TaxID=3988 RepID=B9RJ87_RICCO|nr:conserved hypothetical protein [Ricinus communis]
MECNLQMIRWLLAGTFRLFGPQPNGSVQGGPIHTATGIRQNHYSKEMDNKACGKVCLRLSDADFIW